MKQAHLLLLALSLTLVQGMDSVHGQEFPPYQEGWPLEVNNLPTAPPPLMYLFAPFLGEGTMLGASFTPWENYGLEFVDIAGIVDPNSAPVVWGHNDEYTLVADINGNGELELIMPVNYQQIRIYRTDTSDFPGWPQTIGFNPQGWSSPHHTAICAADMDGDGDSELILGAVTPGSNDLLYNYDVHVIQEDGTPLPGWPKTLPDYQFISGIAVGDLDFDGDPEVVVATANTFYGWWASSPVHAFDHLGQELPGFPAAIPPPPALTGGYMRRPRIADLDGDGSCEIIGNSSQQLTIMGAQGEIRKIYEASDGYGVGSKSVAIGDTDGDGDLDIVIGGGIKLEIYDLHDGRLANIFDLGMQFDGISIADIDGDGDAEISCWNIAGTYLYIYDHQLAPLPGWPLHVESTPLASKYRTYFTDLDYDGDLEFYYLQLTNAGSSILHVLDFPATAGTPKIHWSGLHGNLANTGYYHEGEEYSRFVRGDVNADGSHTLSDPLLALEYLFYGQSVDCKQALDSDANQILDLSDAILSLMQLFGAVTLMEAPFPNCGRASDSSPIDCEQTHPACP